MLPRYGWHAVLTVWQFAPVVTAAVALAAGLYAWGMVRVARRHPARPWPSWRAAMFGGGLAVVVVATQSGIGAYDDVLFWDHMIQHLLLIMVAPPLLVAGEPITLLLHASRNPVHDLAMRAVRSPVATFLTWPPFTCAAYAAVIVVSHLTSAAGLVAVNQAAHNAEHALFLVVGYLFFLPLVGREPVRWRLSYPTRLLILFLTMPVDTFTGVVLGYSGAGAPGVPAGPRPPWAPSPVQDLHIGGAVMWIAGDSIMFAMMMLVFLAWSRDERPAARGWLETVRQANLERVTGMTPAGQSERAGVDDDEHLAAYNAYLARLNRPEPDGARRDTPASGI
jgi:cytochrome c oxidase assembly factor CtaG